MSLNETVAEPYNKYKSIKTITTEDKVIFCWLDGGKYFYKCVASKPLTEEEAGKLQEDQFFRQVSSGGFHKFQTRLIDGIFHTTWSTIERHE